MGGCCAKCGGFDQMKKDIESLKKKVEIINGQSANITKVTDMIKDNLPSIEKAQKLISEKVTGVMSQTTQIKGVSDQITSKVDDLEKKVRGIPAIAKCLDKA